jgi:hypothetical protein
MDSRPRWGDRPVVGTDARQTPTTDREGKIHSHQAYSFKFLIHSIIVMQVPKGVIKQIEYIMARFFLARRDGEKKRQI